jgi:hypothetical protein
MAITRLIAPSITGLTIPNTSINNASLNSVTSLPSGVGGKVLQVVHDNSTSTFSTNSTSYSTIFTPTAITPSSTSSKILVSWYCSFAVLTNSDNLGHIVVQRDVGGSTAYILNSGHNSSMFTFKADLDHQGYGLAFEFEDSPNTTSAVIYRVQHKTDNTGMTMYMNRNISGQSGYMFMTTKEISG